MQDVVTKHLELWSSAVIAKAAAGRGSGNGKHETYGIKKLRELILELAVRGRLVEQDPEDESAKELLRRVASDRLQFLRQGKIGKDKCLPLISKVETPFELPQGWEWERIGNIGHDWGQKTPSEDFTYIDVSAIDNAVGLIKSPNVLSASQAPSRARKIVAKGTVIYSTVRPYLKNISVVSEDYFPSPIASTAFAVLHPFHGMPGDFFALYFRSPVFVKYVESVQTGIAYPAINDKQFFGGLVPIPPLREQHRIVAKVSELMALCDTLEQQQIDSVEAHQVLVETLLAALTRVTSHQELREAWARIAESFELIFTTENSVDQLKATILQLAVMGKLVPQNTNDESARMVLKRIKAEKERKGGKVCFLASIDKEEEPFQLPEGWQWERLGNIGHCVTGKTPSTKIEQYFQGSIPFIGPGQITSSGGLLPPDKHLSEDGIQQSEEAIAGDILMVCIGGSIGKAVICDRRIAFNQQINAIRPLIINPRYLHYSISTTSFLKSVLESSTGSATPIINRSRWEQLMVPVAPLEEQDRIVAKVEELMTVCDHLKSRLVEAQKIERYLADAVVEQATNGGAAPEDAIAA